MKKKMLVMMLTLTTVTSLLMGCGSPKKSEPAATDGGKTEAAKPEAAKPEVEADKNWKIAVVVKDLGNNWFVRMGTGIDKFAKDTGMNAYMKGPSATDAAQQVQVIQDIISQDIDALCVVPVDPAACEPVLKEARDKGIVVIIHEGSTVENCDYDLEAFDNSGYGGFIMDKLAEAMGEEGIYTTMVAHLTNASQNEWADGAVKRQGESFPNIKLLEALPRVESENNSEKAYEVAKEVLKKYPEVKGFVGSSSMDTPGVARAINELGLKDKVFVVGTGMPNECRQLIKDGSLSYITLWDPAEAGYAMCEMARMVLEGKEIGAGTDLGLDSYKSLEVDPSNPKVLMGAGWISINGDNVDDYDF